MPKNAASVQTTSTESRIRLIAFFVLLLITIYLLTGAGLIPVFLTIDFALRGFGLPAYSPLGYLSGRIATSPIAGTLRLSAKPVYMPPKRFSARIGFVFCLAITILHYAAFTNTILALIIAAFAALESLAGFCAGCYVYNAWARLRHR